MRRYRTEIVIAADRYVALQLPEHFPAGAATITVWVAAIDPTEVEPTEADSDRQDIEWWDEFDGPRPAGG